jgi:SAM-dependent methyltransferase
MSPTIKRILRAFAMIFVPEGPILEIGAARVPGQEELANLRPLFRGREYIDVDLREEPGVDRIMEGGKLEFPDGSFQTALCCDALEGAADPRGLAREVLRVLGEGGLVFFSTHQDFPCRREPEDYWRFTQAGLKLLLEPFSRFAVFAEGNWDNPWCLYAIAAKGDFPAWQDKLEEYKLWTESV